MKTELGVIVLFGAVFLLVMMARMHDDIRPSSVQRRAFAGSRPRPSRDPVAPPKAPEAPREVPRAWTEGRIQRVTDFEACGRGVHNWRMVEGVWMDLHPREQDVWVSGAFYKGHFWERDKLNFLVRTMRPNDTFVDIGANIGTFTLQMLKRGHRVIAVEALETNLRRLCASIHKNKFTGIELYKNVMWDDAEGSLSFRVNPTNLGGSSVSTVGSNQSESVPKVRLDEILHVKNYVMKIDIEASECRALTSSWVWAHPPHGITMEWGNLRRNHDLCPLTMFDALVKNISRVYGHDLSHWSGWDAPNMVLQPKTGNGAWGSCAPYAPGNRSAALKSQLLRVVGALDELGVPYALGFGTLLGAVRDRGMNPMEVDNDIIVDRLPLTEAVRRAFRTRGLHIFTQNVLRVCEHGVRSPSPQAPWMGAANYVPYTDIYDRSVMRRVFKLEVSLTDRHFLPTIFNLSVPSDADTKRILARYGNWSLPRVTEPHKQVIHDAFP